jgi:hypothetical protein
MPHKKSHPPPRKAPKPSKFKAQTRAVLNTRIRHVLKQARSPKTSGAEFHKLMQEVLGLEHKLAHLR